MTELRRLNDTSRPAAGPLRRRLAALKARSPLLTWLRFEWTALSRRWDYLRYDDETAIRRLYREYSGLEPDLENPKRFSEKLQWLKLHDRNPLIPICADKYAVRAWLMEKGYGYLLNDLYGVYDRARDIDFRSMPERFVLKATHGSGWNIICRNKATFPKFQARLLLASWLRQNYYWRGREWPYKTIPHRIVCEAYLEDSSGGLRDYKFYCFNGKPRFVQANMGRYTGVHVQNFYDLEWKLLPFGKDLPSTPSICVPAPTTLHQMAEIAALLSEPFIYVRIDFYEVGGRPIFGEFTFCPATGMPDFRPDDYDAVVGEMLLLPTAVSSPSPLLLSTEATVCITP